MATFLAVGGKGGSGKTTLSAMLVRRLLAIGRGPILAVDADSNATLAATLGMPVGETVAEVRDRMGEAAQDVTEIPKERLLGRWLAELLIEGEGVDLLTMGRPEGPKCYCYVNALLRRYLKELRSNYSMVVVDCEAGMEYLSRLTIDDVDVLVLVAEPTPVSMASAGRIARLADSLPISVGRRLLVVNKVDKADRARQAVESVALPEFDGTFLVPFDEDLLARSTRGEPVDERAGDRAAAAVGRLAQACVQGTFGETNHTESLP